MTKKLLNFTLFILTALFALYACGPTDTVTVVQEGPRTVTDERERAPDTDEEDFQQIRIGLIDPVTNFDPLFADNLSTLRAISLIYDTLFDLDRDGNPVPALAERAEVSDDSLTYRVVIDRETFYQDSNVFSAGVGRRVHAGDVKFAFERTARIDVPPAASQLLMNIRGYSSFFTEQRGVYDPEKRVLDSVRGIRVPDAETVEFHLSRPDPDFLKKLASPYLSIYPREALAGDHGLNRRPVGTGAYMLNSIEENRTILELNTSPRFTEQEHGYRVNRIDLIKHSDEGELFQQFIRGDIDWIPEIGPQTYNQVLDADRQIQTSYQNQFEVTQSSASRQLLSYVNEESNRNLDLLKQILNDAEEGHFSLPGTLRIDTGFEVSDQEHSPAELYIALTDDPYGRVLYTDLGRNVAVNRAEFAFIELRVPTRESVLYTRVSDSFHYPYMNTGLLEGAWITVSTPVNGLYHPHIRGVESHAAPWAMPLDRIRVQNRN
jgi:ABC-type transport system substrate-binding protein